MTVLGSGAHHLLGLTAEVVGRNQVRWSAAQLSNESALPRTTDWMDKLTPICQMKNLPLGSSRYIVVCDVVSTCGSVPNHNR